jgi:hypothetical protein
MKITKLIALCASLVIIGLMLTGPSQAAIDTKSIVGVWLLDEAGGSVVKDASGNKHNGTIKGTATWGNGKYGGGLVFDGKTYVEIPDAKDLQLSKNQTITIWLNASEAATDWVRLVGKGVKDLVAANGLMRNYGLWRALNSSLLYQIYDEKAVAGNAMKDGDPAVSAPLKTWVHMAGVYDGKNMILYKDGKAVVTVAFAGEPMKTTDPLTIGFTGSIHGYFKGTLDEVGIFNVPLAAADIVTIMDKGLGAVTTAVSSEGRLATTWGDIKK